jgi:hypothetical protein
MDYNTVGVTRHCPITHRSVVMVAYTAFSNQASSCHVSDLFNSCQVFGPCQL